MKFLYLILVGFSFQCGIAQDANTKRVVVVPYGRFEFISEFSLEDIAKKNNTVPEKVFPDFQKAILNVFVEFDDENFQFVEVDPSTIEKYKKYIVREDGKYKGKSYYATNIKSFKEEMFSKFMDLHKADFILFLNWYEIKKESYTPKNKYFKRTSYAGHYVDYDIYNLFKQQLDGKGKFKIKSEKPDDEQIDFKLLRLKEVKVAYQYLVHSILEQLNKPIEN